jgi:hypothetical protein
MIRGACPLCSVLREFQAIAVEKIDPTSAGPLCNFHCWSVANSAPAMVALSVYSNMLLTGNREPTAECLICNAIHAEEEKRISEFIDDLQKVRFREWMTRFGGLCHIHGTRLKQTVPPEFQATIIAIIDRNTTELDQQLREYAATIEAGDHSGGGVLGKAAAFLVGYRGLLP